jgi:hypothetical protein
LKDANFPAISTQVETLAARLLGEAHELGLTIRTLADGSVETAGTTKPLQLARIARQLDTAARVLKEIGL